MLVFLFASHALAADPLPEEGGVLVIDARLPAEILVDSQQVAQLYGPARLSIDLQPGVHRLRVYTNGDPSDLEVAVPAGGEVPVLVGRTGLSVDRSALRSAPRDVAEGDIPVQVRMTDRIGARLVVGTQRYAVAPGQQLELALPAGDHPLSIRSEDGTVVWARGVLSVDGPDPVVVQLSEGRLPEVSGRGAFTSGR